MGPVDRPEPEASPGAAAYAIRRIHRSLHAVDKNPAEHKTQMPVSNWAELEEFAHSVGVDDVGYARLSETLIFRNKAVVYPNAILLTSEMDKDRIETSPSEESFVCVYETYHHLGEE